MITKHIKDIIQGKNTLLGSKRSSRWSAVRKQHLENHPTCAACGGTKLIEVHHIQPFHEKPELELDPNNLISLCESKSYGLVCHRTIGHRGDYKKINPNVITDAASIKRMLLG